MFHIVHTAAVRSRCIGVVNTNRRRSTSCITLTTVERVVDDCTKFITHCNGHCDEKNCVDRVNKNLLPCQCPLSNRNPVSQQSSMTAMLPILKILRRSVT